jgi:hypothetical protein
VVLLCLALVAILAAHGAEAAAGTEVWIDPYPPNGPRHIPDITTAAGTVQLASDEIVDVVILGDGYLASENATFQAHAQQWYNRTFGSGAITGIRPYTYFKQAFRVRAVWEPSPGRASIVSRDSSHYRIKIDPSDTSVASGDWHNGTSEPNRGFRDSLYKVLDALLDPKDTTRYPSNLDNTVYGIQITHDSMANVYSHLYIVMLIRATGDKNPGGRCRTVIKPGGPQRVRVAFGTYEQHEFGHAYGYLDDEYIDDRNAVNVYYRNPEPDLRSVFNLTNINFLPTSPMYDDPDDRCDDMLIWPHLAPGGKYNPSIRSLIGNMFAGMDKYEVGAAHSEYKCLLNGTHESYFCDFEGDYKNLRDYFNMCFWCEEIVAVRTLERTHQLQRAGDSTDIHSKGRQWYRLWDDSLRDAYYNYFNIDSLIVLKDSCFDLSCPACSLSCGTIFGDGMPACIAECEIRDVGHSVFVDGDLGSDLDNGSSLTPKASILGALLGVCEPHHLILIKPASYPGAITISEKSTLAAAGCSSVVIGK